MIPGIYGLLFLLVGWRWVRSVLLVVVVSAWVGVVVVVVSGVGVFVGSLIVLMGGSCG